MLLSVELMLITAVLKLSMLALIKVLSMEAVTFNPERQEQRGILLKIESNTLFLLLFEINDHFQNFYQRCTIYNIAVQKCV